MSRKYAVSQDLVDTLFGSYSGGRIGPEQNSRGRDGLSAVFQSIAENPVESETAIDRVACMIWSFNLENRRHKHQNEVDIWDEEAIDIKTKYWRIAKLAIKITFSESFLAPKEKFPEEIKDLLAEEIQYPSIPLSIDRSQYNEDLIEAFRRGQKTVK